MATPETIRYERFSEEVFFVLFVTFQIPRRMIPCPKGPINAYSKSSDLLKCITRGIMLDQILCRHVFYDQFEKEYSKSQAFLDTKDTLAKYIRRFIHWVYLQAEDHQYRNDIFTKVIQTFTILTELVLYLIHKKTRTYIKKISLIWYEFFTDELKAEYEAEGGILAMQKKYKMLGDFIDGYLESFIPNHGIPYCRKNLYELYLRGHPNAELLKDLEKKYLEMDKQLQNKKPVDEPPIIDEDELLYGLEIHPRLGIVPHELKLAKVLQQSPTESETDISVTSPPRLSPSERREKKLRDRLLKWKKTPPEKTGMDQNISPQERSLSDGEGSVQLSLSRHNKNNVHFKTPSRKLIFSDQSESVGNSRPFDYRCNISSEENLVIAKESPINLDRKIENEFMSDGSVMQNVQIYDIKTDTSKQERSKEREVSAGRQSPECTILDYSALGARPKVRNVQCSKVKEDSKRKRDSPASKGKLSEGRGSPEHIVLDYSVMKTRSEVQNMQSTYIQQDANERDRFSLGLKKKKSTKGENAKSKEETLSPTGSVQKSKNMQSIVKGTCEQPNSNLPFKDVRLAESPIKEARLQKDAKSPLKETSLIQKCEKSILQKASPMCKKTKSPSKKSGVILKDVGLLLEAIPDPRDAKSPIKIGFSDPKNAKSPLKGTTPDLKTAKSPIKAATSDSKNIKSPIKMGIPDPKNIKSPIKMGIPDPKNIKLPIKMGIPDPKNIKSPTKVGIPDPKIIKSPVKSTTPDQKNAKSSLKLVTSDPKDAKSNLMGSNQGPKETKSPIKTVSINALFESEKIAPQPKDAKLLVKESSSDPQKIHSQKNKICPILLEEEPKGKTVGIQSENLKLQISEEKQLPQKISGSKDVKSPNKISIALQSDNCDSKNEFVTAKSPKKAKKKKKKK